VSIAAGHTRRSIGYHGTGVDNKHHEAGETAGEPSGIIMNLAATSFDVTTWTQVCGRMKLAAA